ncbi:hypothetical protein GCK72_001435 [Caenorhabditis remanei]|uniref:Regulator of microtubule dynamics protein 1 n=1 Tax=Caenorhabditis remanei TaxID=31234 RepID=A0A6A5HNY3_CAERE|nr:hypothetical protein GCK72_001435 [Caenorhabditis remanei]KAF1769618.1 hypothetical protein GCK72_001435 [Caenorhabditis remanei]
MFKRAASSGFRFAFNSTTSKFQRFKQVPKLLAITGGASMGIAFFGKAEEKKPENLEQVTGNSEKPKNFDLIVQNADELYDNYLIDNCYNILKKFESSKCSELLWRLARVVCEKGKLAKDPNERKELILEAYEIIKKALENEPKEGCFGAHKWYAILLDYVGEIEGNKSRIEKSFLVREHLEKALSYFENDPTTWHILGVWHFSFANMGYATRMVAKAIFATPPSSTYQDALHYFLKAEQISPGFYSTNTYYIGEVYEQLGQKQDAIDAFKKSFKMPVVTSDDAAIHKKAYEKLKKYGVKDSEVV